MTRLARLIAIPAPALGLALGLALAAPAALMAAGDGGVLETTVAAETLKENKQTKAGLYITAAEAIAVMAERDDLALIDVRSPEETMFIGYATATDQNIPFKLVSPDHGYNAKKSAYAMIDNPDFIADMNAFIAANDPAALLIMCRSGSRSARAVDALVEAGIDIPAYSVVDGFEGDKAGTGARTVNGWRNAGGEWTYKVRADLLPASR